MAKYYDKQKLDAIFKASKDIVDIRNRLLKEIDVDILDTDAISSAFIYQIVSQYDPNYNVNFARNGEDAKSNDILIEQKSTRVLGPLTRTGKQRKGAGTDAAFQFHAMGNLSYPRYIFTAKDKHNLNVVRLYDIGEPANCAIVEQYLLAERAKWLASASQNQSNMKRDIILCPEKFILANIKFPIQSEIDGCQVFRDQ